MSHTQWNIDPKVEDFITRNIAHMQKRGNGILDLEQPPPHSKTPTMEGDDFRFLAARLKDCTELRKLSLKDQNVTDDVAPAIAEIIRNNPGLEILELSNSRRFEGRKGFSATGMAMIADALKSHPKFTTLIISGQPLGAGGGEVIAKFLHNCPSLCDLSAQYCELGKEGFQNLAKHMGHLPTRLTSFSLENNGRVGVATAKSVLSRLQHSPDMLKLTLSDQGMDKEDKGKLAESVQRYYLPNLRIFHPYCDWLQRETAAPNREKANATVSSMTKGDYRELSFPALADIEERLPLIKNAPFPAFAPHKRDDVLNRYAAFRATLPDLPDTPDALFTPNESGFAPIETPQNWRNPETMFSLMEQETPLEMPALQQTTQAGHSVLEIALRCAPVGLLIPALNKRGIYLGKAALLDENGQANDCLNAIAKRGGVGTLFLPENWKTCRNTGDVTAVHLALDKTYRMQAPNLHSLKLEISRTIRRENKQPGLGA